ncbi:MAG: penicillin-binding transpeptidase domain-containing protein, partial [Oscillospiraceae bacterium]
VMKIITAAAALDSGTYTQDDTFYCGSQVMVEGWDKPMGCAQGHDHGTPTLRRALIDSCNVSFIKMSAGMGSSVWYDYIRAFGLTEPTGVDLPGEPSQSSINNLVYSEDQMGPVQLASCSFGQSNKYTPIQMITAVSAVVNGGNLMQPYIVSQELDAAGNVVKNYDPVVKRQVISPETSAIICDALEEMVANTSNGQNAYLAGYRVGGKSGTAEKLEVRTQEDRDAYVSSFLGFAPADDPQIAVLVALDEPEDTEMGNYFGGRLAGPTVREIIRDSMGILGVEPDYATDAEKARSVVSCPRLTDHDLSYAQRLLNQAELNYKVIGEGTTVIGQNPPAGGEVPYGGEVLIYTDAGIPQEFVTMPDLVGRPPGSSIELLKGLGLNVITTGAPNDGDNVQVVEQSVAPETQLAKGSVVTLTMQNMSAVADR